MLICLLSFPHCARPIQSSAITQGRFVSVFLFASFLQTYKSGQLFVSHAQKYTTKDLIQGSLKKHIGKHIVFVSWCSPSFDDVCRHFFNVSYLPQALTLFFRSTCFFGFNKKTTQPSKNECSSIGMLSLSLRVYI